MSKTSILNFCIISFTLPVLAVAGKAKTVHPFRVPHVINHELVGKRTTEGAPLKERILDLLQNLYDGIPLTVLQQEYLDDLARHLANHRDFKVGSPVFGQIRITTEVAESFVREAIIDIQLFVLRNGIYHLKARPEDKELIIQRAFSQSLRLFQINDINKDLLPWVTQALTYFLEDSSILPYGEDSIATKGYMHYIAAKLGVAASLRPIKHSYDLVDGRQTEKLQSDLTAFDRKSPSEQVANVLQLNVDGKVLTVPQTLIVPVRGSNFPDLGVVYENSDLVVRYKPIRIDDRWMEWKLEVIQK